MKLIWIYNAKLISFKLFDLSVWKVNQDEWLHSEGTEKLKLEPISLWLLPLNDLTKKYAAKIRHL